MTDYTGILFIGDPHFSSSAPGYRKDDYPRAILGKIEWALNYARDNRLLPAILGDWFHFPRQNSNWLLVELLRLLCGPVLGIYGNHDTAENQLGDDDSLSLIHCAGKILLLDENNLWQGVMNGRPVILGGTPWGRPIPKEYPGGRAPGALVFWMTHHDIRFGGYEEAGRFKPFEIPGVDAVINGHIHRRLEDIRTGSTVWMNPGNISRVTRSDASRQRIPAALRVDVNSDGWSATYIEIPHRAFDEVFHEDLSGEDVPGDISLFVAGLENLRRLRTSDGTGLMTYIEQNADRFDPLVAEAIRNLAREVCSHG